MTYRKGNEKYSVIGMKKTVDAENNEVDLKEFFLESMKNVLIGKDESFSVNESKKLIPIIEKILKKKKTDNDRTQNI